MSMMKNFSMMEILSIEHLELSGKINEWRILEVKQKISKKVIGLVASASFMRNVTTIYQSRASR